MNTTNQTRELKMKHWAEIIHECKNSGMSARQWMQENGIQKHQFYYWQRQLRAAALRTASKDTSSLPVHTLVEITQPAETQAATSDTIVDESQRDPMLSIKIADAVIEIGRNTTPDILRMALQEIRHAE